MYHYTEVAEIYVFHYLFNEQNLHTTNDTIFKSQKAQWYFSRANRPGLLDVISGLWHPIVRHLRDPWIGNGVLWCFVTLAVAACGSSKCPKAYLYLYKSMDQGSTMVLDKK